jgi:beclin 1
VGIVDIDAEGNGDVTSFGDSDGPSNGNDGTGTGAGSDTAAKSTTATDGVLTFVSPTAADAVAAAQWPREEAGDVTSAPATATTATTGQGSSQSLGISRPEMRKISDQTRYLSSSFRKPKLDWGPNTSHRSATSSSSSALSSKGVAVGGYNNPTKDTFAVSPQDTTAAFSSSSSVQYPSLVSSSPERGGDGEHNSLPSASTATATATPTSTTQTNPSTTPPVPGPSASAGAGPLPSLSPTVSQSLSSSPSIAVVTSAPQSPTLYPLASSYSPTSLTSSVPSLSGGGAGGGGSSARSSGGFLHADPKLSATLFQKCTSDTEIDFPLCIECAPLLIEELNELAEETRVETLQYTHFLDNFANHDDSAATLLSTSSLPTSTTPTAATAATTTATAAIHLSDLHSEERLLKARLDRVLHERTLLDKDLEVVSNQERHIDGLSDQFWSAFGQWKVSHQQVQDDLSSVQTRLSYTAQQLDRLESSIILNDAFNLWVDGHFGTVNGLRLGRIPSVPVDWAEISAAVGLAAHLLHEMARVIGFNFTKYRIVPAGSSTKIERLSDKQLFDLHGERDLGLMRLFWYRRFDSGIVAFLSCVDEFSKYIQAYDPEFKLPYEISDDKIDGKSIRIQFNSEESWTKALKFMITNIKWLLAWMVKSDRF